MQRTQIYLEPELAASPMRRLGIQEAFAFDRNFLVAGFALMSDQ